MPLSRGIARFVILAVGLGACGGATAVDATDTSDASPPQDASAGDGSTLDAPGDASTLDAPIDAGPAARAIVTVHGGAAAGCVTVPPMTVGDFGAPAAGVPAKSVANDERVDGKRVGVACRVAALSDGFEIDATVSVEGGPRLKLTGKTDLKGSSSATVFSLAQERTWTSPTCKLDVSAISPQGGAASGRYWGLVTCAGATSDLGATCDIFGQIRLENCRP